MVYDRQVLSGDDPASAQRLTEFVPFLDYDVEIRKILCSTNAIKSLNTRFRTVMRAQGHFPTR